MSLVHLGRSSIQPGIPAVPLAGATPGAPAPPKDYFEGLTKYIPGETLTIFVAAMAIKDSLASLSIGPHKIYAICAALTPLILWISAVNAHRAAGKTGYPFPWWRMLAATIAFLVWALSIPPMLNATQLPIAGLGALIISTFLTLFDPLFDK